MKRYFALLTLGLAFCLMALPAHSQLNFVNNTGCTVRVMGWYSNVGPCVAPVCASPWISVPAGGIGVLAGGPCGGIPGPPSFFFRLRMTDGLGGFVMVDLCTFPAAPYNDCMFLPRTLQILDPHNAITF